MSEGSYDMTLDCHENMYMREQFLIIFIYFGNFVGVRIFTVAARKNGAPAAASGASSKQKEAFAGQDWFGG